MFLFNYSFFSIVIIAFIASILYIKKLINLSKDHNIQNVRAINLYLDKKLVSKLLTICLGDNQIYRIQQLMDEILHYFCLDYMAIKIKNNDNILSFKSSAMYRLFPESEVKSLLSQASTIDEEIGNKNIKEEDYRQFIVFKHESLSMIAVLEAKHNLSNEEKETLGNEIMLIIKIAIFATINQSQKLVKLI